MPDEGRTLSPETRRRLELSEAGARGRTLRTVRCPVCGFRLLEVYGTEHSYVRVKCRKCKFCDTIDTALFRTCGRGGARRG